MTSKYNIFRMANSSDYYKKILGKYFYGLFSSDFVFNRDKFSIDKKDEVLHTDKRILMSMEEFQSCINDLYICIKTNYFEDGCGLEHLIKEESFLSNISSFIIGRRTTLDKIDVEIKREDINLHPTPYEVVYELFMYLNDSFSGNSKDEEEYKTVTRLLQTYSKDKNEAVIFLRWYSQDGFRIGSLAKALNDAGFNLFKYDKENKIITYIKYPTLQSFSK